MTHSSWAWSNIHAGYHMYISITLTRTTDNMSATSTQRKQHSKHPTETRQNAQRLQNKSSHLSTHSPSQVTARDFWMEVTTLGINSASDARVQPLASAMQHQWSPRRMLPLQSTWLLKACRWEARAEGKARWVRKQLLDSQHLAVEPPSMTTLTTRCPPLCLTHLQTYFFPLSPESAPHPSTNVELSARVW